MGKRRSLNDEDRVYREPVLREAPPWRAIAMGGMDRYNPDGKVYQAHMRLQRQHIAGVSAVRRTEA